MSPVEDWANRNPYYQAFSDYKLAKLAKAGDKAAKLEIEWREVSKKLEETNPLTSL